MTTIERLTTQIQTEFLEIADKSAFGLIRQNNYCAATRRVLSRSGDAVLKKVYRELPEDRKQEALRFGLWIAVGSLIGSADPLCDPAVAVAHRVLMDGAG